MTWGFAVNWGFTVTDFVFCFYGTAKPERIEPGFTVTDLVFCFYGTAKPERKNRDLPIRTKSSNQVAALTRQNYPDISSVTPQPKTTAIENQKQSLTSRSLPEAMK